ncbi:MAG: TIGR02147 family protein [Bdellovibrio sp.]
MNSKNDNQSEKNIFFYDDYRTYLKDTYKSLKEKDKNFSFRFFARVAGFSSPSFLKLVMDGKSNLSTQSIQKFSKALKHNKDEAKFFYHLVLLNQATNSTEKQLHATEILKSVNYRKIHPLSGSLFSYISKWYFVVIKEMVDLKDFKEDPAWIAAKLKNAITVHEVKSAIDEMIALGILMRDSEGKLLQSKTFIMTADEVTSSSAAQFHRDMMKKAGESIDNVPRNKRELSALTVGVSAETALTIKNMIQEFRHKIMDLCMEDKTPEAVYQVNLHLFPLAESDSEDKK